MLTLLAFGTIWFWFLAFAMICFLTMLVENEHGFGATVVFLFSLLALDWIWRVPLISIVWLHPGTTLTLVAVYFVIGTIWSIIKWYLYLHNKLVTYNERKADFLEAHHATELTPQLASEMKQSMCSSWGPRYPIAPNAREHKSDLTLWATYWPFSMLGTMLNDFVRKVWEYIYELFQSTYQKISHRVFRNVEADMRMAEQYRNGPKID